LAVTFFALNVRDLDGWRYAYIGDEGGFFDWAREIGGSGNLFSQYGPYGYHPSLSSAYQAMVMKVFGVDYFGWKMASLLSVVATFPAFYVLMRVAFGLRPAAFATLFLSASHYLFAYAHTGYDNIFALFPAVSAFALFFIGWRYASSFALFAAGMAAGLGFYTFYSARAAIVVLAVFVLTMGFRRWRPSFAGVVALGFSLAALPIFAVDKMDVINAMLDQSARVSAVPLWKQLLENLPRSLFAFNYNPSEGHYLAGSLMDVASAVLAVLGLSYSLSRIRSGSHRFLVIWYTAALVATGLFSPYDRVTFERMHIVLPAMAAFAGIAVDQTLVVLEDALRSQRLKPLLTGLALVVLVPLVFALNIHRFWVDSARASPTHTITVAVRAVMEGPCAGNGSRNAIVTEQSQVPSAALDYVFSIYGLTDNKPALLSYEGESAGTLAGFRCVVLVAVDRPPAQSLLQDLLRDDPARSVDELRDLSRSTRVLVVRRPG
jgi:4-amino-4-deoxy-L-arabinose transferase-like glycosyltransferase